MSLDQKYKTLLNSYHINTPQRVSMFMAQIQHESQLKPKAENLNYSAQGLANTFPKRYAIDPKAKMKVPNKLAESLNRNPEAIANNCYANRMGNGDEASGDGWKYRGRGFIQCTGKDNYLMLSKDTRIDCLNNPDILLNEAEAMISACWYWGKRKLNEFANNDDVLGCTKAINGGTIGLAERTELYHQWLELLT